MSYSGKTSGSEAYIRASPYGRRPARSSIKAINNDVEQKETEGEKQLKVLLNQQLDTKLTIEQQYHRHRTFQPSTTYNSITNIVSGQLNAEEFQNCTSRQQAIDDLRQMGLDEEEVVLKLRHDGKQEQAYPSFGAEPSVVKQQLEGIQAKIDAKKEQLSKPGTSREAKQLSRHEMELEQSLKPTSHQSQLFRNLVTTNATSKNGIHPDDPINYLKTMEKELLDKVETVLSSKRRIGGSPTHKHTEDFCDQLQNEMKSGHRLEVIGKQNPKEVPLPNGNGEEQSCSNVEKLLTKESPVIRAFVVPVSFEDVERSRLTFDQITSIPRFENHSYGEPSNASIHFRQQPITNSRALVLYLKNLAKGICETDLIAIFGRFQKDSASPLEYRLLNGKMKGQAFVTFPDESLATEALKFAHGFVWKGKPLIIQYGRLKGS